MKYIVALIGSLLIFIGAFFLLGIGCAMTMPASWSQIWLDLGVISTNISSLFAFILASLAATHSFRATLRIYNRKIKTATPAAAPH